MPDSSKVAERVRIRSAEAYLIITFIVASKAALFFVSLLTKFFTDRLLTRSGLPVQPFSLSAFGSLWSQWDSVFFITIAVQGYAGNRSLASFFPLYPFLIALVNSILHDATLSAVLVSNIASVFVFFYLYKLIKLEFGRKIAEKSLLYFTIFPLAFLLCAAYSESVYLAFAVAAFYYARTYRWWIAGVLGFFAITSRLVGITIFFALLYEYLSQKEVIEGLKVKIQNIRCISWDIIPLILMPAGLIAVFATYWLVFGNPFAYFTAEAAWNRAVTFPWVTIRSDYGRLNSLVIFNYLSLGLVLTLVAYGFKRLRPTYLIFIGLNVLIPLLSNTMDSAVRYYFVLFPIFMILGILGNRYKVADRVMLVTFPIMLGYLASVFVLGWLTP